MKKTLDVFSFVREFEYLNRADEFSTTALELLFIHLEKQEKLSGKETELDVIDLCENYTQYHDFNDFQIKNYTREQILNEDCIIDFEDLEDITEVIKMGTHEGEGFILLNFIR